MGTELSIFEQRALIVIQGFPKGIHTRLFARWVWPDSPSWRRTYNCGVKGATRGTGIMICAGQHLARLRKKGLLVRTSVTPERKSGSYHIRYHVSKRGLELLRIYPQPKPRFVLRKIENGRVKILRRWFVPSAQWMEYDGRLDGMVYAFGIFWEAVHGAKPECGYRPSPFVNCWGREQNYREADRRKWEPDPQVVDGRLPWVWWEEEKDASN